MKISVFDINFFPGFEPEKPEAIVLVPYTDNGEAKEPILQITKNLSENTAELKRVVIAILNDMTPKQREVVLFSMKQPPYLV